MAADEKKGADKGSGARLMALLKIVGESEGDCALKDIAAQMALPPSSVHRLLQILVRGGFIERGRGTSYRAGPELFRLSSNILSKMHYVAAVRPYLRSLWEKWQETAVFCLYQPAHHRAIVAERILTPHNLRHVMEPYTELSLAWGSLGRSILAYLDAEDAHAAQSVSKAGPITGDIAPSVEELEEELDRIRATGRAVFRSEGAQVAGIAAPVFRSGGVVIGSIGVTMPTSRFDSVDQDEMSSDVIDAARHLCMAFGHSDMPEPVR